MFIYSGSARLVSFEMKLISKEVSRAEPEYMNIHPPPPISVLATALILSLPETIKKNSTRAVFGKEPWPETSNSCHIVSCGQRTFVYC